MPAGFDQEIVQDFLTESGELLEQLEGDLVALEQTPRDPELLNKVFRALHTIKGSASFLALTNLVKIAHASESALNAARNGQVVVDKAVMDLLLQAVDLLKVHMQQIRDGVELTEPAAELVAQLTAVGEGRQPGSTGGAAAAMQEDAPAGDFAGEDDVPPGATRLDLGPEKRDLLEFMVADLDETVSKIQSQLDTLRDDAGQRAHAADHIRELGESMSKTAEFFGLSPTLRLGALVTQAAQSAPNLSGEQIGQLVPRMLAVVELVKRQSTALNSSLMLDWPLDTLVGRVELISRGEALPAGAQLPQGADAEAALIADGVEGGAEASAVSGPGVPQSEHEAEGPERDEHAPTGGNKEGGKGSAASVEQTIRVEVGRLETLMNLVGELVLQKNRLSDLSRKIELDGKAAGDLREAFALSSNMLDRVTGDIQVAVMKTRMQPLDKLFGKYPRLIRDLARKTSKKIELVIEGGDTEVDKSVLEELGDPLVHLLRNSADHGIESPEARVAAGKPETGTITLRASNDGGHVQVLVIDDGKGLQRERIAKKAVERGLATAEQVATMSDRDVFQFIFEAGFSTAEQVSDLSGRGVGMDVVRTNIEKIKGTIELSSVPGRGTTLQIKIPLTVAIMPAMMVGVAHETYAIPLSAILEIVKPSAEHLGTIRERPVMRLRDSVLPLLDAQDLFRVAREDREKAPFAVVVEHNQVRVGLLVTRLIGQQEIVIKPLDGAGGEGDARGPVSGATVRNDGGVSLIVDVSRLIRLAGQQQSTEGSGVAPASR